MQPQWALDNWVYAANGGSGGNIRSEVTGKTANLRGHDLRFKPDTGEFELVWTRTRRTSSSEMLRAAAATGSTCTRMANFCWP